MDNFDAFFLLHSSLIVCHSFLILTRFCFIEPSRFQFVAFVCLVLARASSSFFFFALFPFLLLPSRSHSVAHRQSTANSKNGSQPCTETSTHAGWRRETTGGGERWSRRRCLTHSARFLRVAAELHPTRTADEWRQHVCSLSLHSSISRLLSLMLHCCCACPLSTGTPLPMPPPSASLPPRRSAASAALRDCQSKYADFKQNFLRLGDDAPDFEADSSLGKLNFHEWIGPAKERGQRLGHVDRRRRSRHRRTTEPLTEMALLLPPEPVFDCCCR